MEEPPIPQVDYTDTCRRPPWAQLPTPVQEAVGAAAGSPVVSADPSVRSGFTGGFAAVVHLVDGRRVFAKAGSSRNPHLVAAYDREAVVLQALPSACPAPAFVGAASLEPGEVDEHEWSVVVAEVVDGSIPQPWSDAHLSAVHEACLQTAAALTDGAILGLELVPMSHELGADAQVVGCFPSLADGSLRLTDGQPAWVMTRLDELAGLVAKAPRALAGDVACHADLRADNVLVADDGRAVLVDWNWLGLGPSWVDFVGVLPLARADGVDVEGWLRRSPLTRDVDPGDVDTWLAVIAAYMLAGADRPVWPGGPPAVRVHQRRYARTFLDWLGARRGWHSS